MKTSSSSLPDYLTSPLSDGELIQIIVDLCRENGWEFLHEFSGSHRVNILDGGVLQEQEEDEILSVALISLLKRYAMHFTHEDFDANLNRILELDGNAEPTFHQIQEARSIFGRPIFWTSEYFQNRGKRKRW